MAGVVPHGQLRYALGIPTSELSRESLHEGLQRVASSNLVLTEWAEGFGPRFGLLAVDYKTQKRTGRFSNVLLKNALKDQ